MWVQFWDMNSGGGQKEKWSQIYIEAASEEEACVIFYNRFEHNPQRVTCTCCGEDYSISSHEDFAQLTGFHRGCNTLEQKKYKRGKLKGLGRTLPKDLDRYYEGDEESPDGWEFDKTFSKDYQTVNQYKRRKDVLVINRHQIRVSERIGEVPEEGYVWV